MGISHKFLVFVDILRESIKLLPKNGKLMALLFASSFLLYSIAYLLNFFSIRPLLMDMITQSIPTDPSEPEHDPILNMIKDIKSFLGLEALFYLCLFIISFCTTIAFIFVTATSYFNKGLSLKELFLWTIKSWYRPLVTIFYVQLLTIGYLYICTVVMLIPYLMFLNNPLAGKAVMIMVGIIAFTFYLYLSVVWQLAIVISVVEEKIYGLEALGKGVKIVNGKRVDGFMLVFAISLVSLVIFYLYWKVSAKDAGQMVQVSLVQLVTAVCMIFVYMLIVTIQVVAFTVFYFQCKRFNGEEIELQGNIGYSQIPSSLPLAHQDIL